jgi:hypothetical protein
MSLRIPFLTSMFAFMVAFAGTSTTVAQAGVFRIQNNGDHTIIGVWVTSELHTTWGTELLGEDVLDPGYYVAENASGCHADIRLLYANGHVRTRYNFDTCEYDLESNY